MKLFSRVTGSKESFTPLKPPAVSLYSCGPTVYDYTHIGHLRTYTNVDTLKRLLIASEYKVNHVMNITDVGHLTGDTDEGEDKLERGALRENKTVWDIARQYEKHFFSSLHAMNISKARTICRATENIESMIAMITTLEKKGYTYQTEEAVYFNTSKFPAYGDFSGQNLDDKKTAARTAVHEDTEKKRPADFVLWFFRRGRFEHHVMHWPSPWGVGFPGWHIECSAMSQQFLGDTIDIHTGGVDHISVHHENEIAQSEAATGKPFVRYWFHSQFVLVDGVKMSKSLQNTHMLEDVKKKGYHPMALRYLFLQTSYTSHLNFTWKSLDGATQAYEKLQALAHKLPNAPLGERSEKSRAYQTRMLHALRDNLNTPQALAVVWEGVKSTTSDEDLRYLLKDAEDLLGLVFQSTPKAKIPPAIIALGEEREKARKMRDFEGADRIRTRIEQEGYTIEDTDTGFHIEAKRTA